MIISTILHPLTFYVFCKMFPSFSLVFFVQLPRNAPSENDNNADNDDDDDIIYIHLVQQRYHQLSEATRHLVYIFMCVCFYLSCTKVHGNTVVIIITTCLSSTHWYHWGWHVKKRSFIIKYLITMTANWKINKKGENLCSSRYVLGTYH